jgi:hypothetical protein
MMERISVVVLTAKIGNNGKIEAAFNRAEQKP